MKRFSLVFFALCIVGCANSYTVTHVKNLDDFRNPPSGKNAIVPEGIRFHLPEKYIYVEPQADGSVKAKFVYFKDPKNAFTIASRSRLQNNKLTVTVANGLLTKVSFTQDDTAAASKLAESIAAREVAEIKAEKVDETAALAKTKEEAATRAALQTAVSNASLAEAQAQAEYDVMKGALPANNELVLNAKSALEKAKLAHTAAKEARDKSNELANKPPITINAYGPAFFKVVETDDDVKLQPMMGWSDPEVLQLRIAVEPSKAALAAIQGEGTSSVSDCVIEGKDFKEVFSFEVIDERAYLKWLLEDDDDPTTELKIVALSVVNDKTGEEVEANSFSGDKITRVPPDGFPFDLSTVYHFYVTRINGVDSCKTSGSFSFNPTIIND